MRVVESYVLTIKCEGREVRVSSPKREDRRGSRLDTKMKGSTRVALSNGNAKVIQLRRSAKFVSKPHAMRFASLKEKREGRQELRFDYKTRRS